MLSNFLVRLIGNIIIRAQILSTKMKTMKNPINFYRKRFSTGYKILLFRSRYSRLREAWPGSFYRSLACRVVTRRKFSWQTDCWIHLWYCQFSCDFISLGSSLLLSRAKIPSAKRCTIAVVSYVADMSSDVMWNTEPIISCILSDNTQLKTGN